MSTENETPIELKAENGRSWYLDYLRFCSESNKLFWLPRDPSTFKDDGEQTAEHNCNAWNGKCAGKPTFNTESGHGYKHGRLENKNRYAHRIIWEFFNGPIPEGMDIDHINGDRSDNRPENLRVVTRSQNLRNSVMKSRNTSGITGVCREGASKWKVRIHADGGKPLLIGVFETKDAARTAAELFYGDPANGYTARHGKSLQTH